MGGRAYQSLEDATAQFQIRITPTLKNKLVQLANKKRLKSNEIKLFSPGKESPHFFNFIFLHTALKKHVTVMPRELFLPHQKRYRSVVAHQDLSDEEIAYLPDSKPEGNSL